MRHALAKGQLGGRAGDQREVPGAADHPLVAQAERRAQRRLQIGVRALYERHRNRRPDPGIEGLLRRREGGQRSGVVHQRSRIGGEIVEHHDRRALGPDKVRPRRDALVRAEVQGHAESLTGRCLSCRPVYAAEQK